MFFLSSLPSKAHSVSVLFRKVIASWVFDNIHTKSWANVSAWAWIKASYKMQIKAIFGHCNLGNPVQYS